MLQFKNIFNARKSAKLHVCMIIVDNCFLLCVWGFFFVEELLQDRPLTIVLSLGAAKFAIKNTLLTSSYICDTYNYTTYYAYQIICSQLYFYSCHFF